MKTIDCKQMLTDWQYYNGVNERTNLRKIQIANKERIRRRKKPAAEQCELDGENAFAYLFLCVKKPHEHFIYFD